MFEEYCVISTNQFETNAVINMGIEKFLWAKSVKYEVIAKSKKLARIIFNEMDQTDLSVCGSRTVRLDI